MAGYVPAPIEIPAAVQAELGRFEPLFVVGREVHDIGQRIHGELDRPERTHLQTVAYVIFGKAFRTMQSILNLCLCGCGVDGLSLCASLFENLTDLRYLKKAPIRRPLRYTQFEQVEKLYQAEKILAHKRLPKGMRKRYRWYQKHLHAQVAELTGYFPNRSRGWAQKSLKRGRKKWVWK